MDTISPRLLFMIMSFTVMGLVSLSASPFYFYSPLFFLISAGLYMKKEWARKMALTICFLSAVGVIALYFPVFGSAFFEQQELSLRIATLLLLELIIFCLIVVGWEMFPKK